MRPGKVQSSQWRNQLESGVLLAAHGPHAGNFTGKPLDFVRKVWQRGHHTTSTVGFLTHFWTRTTRWAVMCNWVVVSRMHGLESVMLSRFNPTKRGAPKICWLGCFYVFLVFLKCGCCNLPTCECCWGNTGGWPRPAPCCALHGWVLLIPRSGPSHLGPKKFTFVSNRLTQILERNCWHHTSQLFVSSDDFMLPVVHDVSWSKSILAGKTRATTLEFKEISTGYGDIPKETQSHQGVLGRHTQDSLLVSSKDGGHFRTPNRGGHVFWDLKLHHAVWQYGLKNFQTYRQLQTCPLALTGRNLDFRERSTDQICVTSQDPLRSMRHRPSQWREATLLGVGSRKWQRKITISRPKPCNMATLVRFQCRSF